jgi:hypothetical protein
MYPGESPGKNSSAVTSTIKHHRSWPHAERKRAIILSSLGSNPQAGTVKYFLPWPSRVQEHSLLLLSSTKVLSPVPLPQQSSASGSMPKHGSCHIWRCRLLLLTVIYCWCLLRITNTCQGLGITGEAVSCLPTMSVWVEKKGLISGFVTAWSWGMRDVFYCPASAPILDRHCIGPRVSEFGFSQWSCSPPPTPTPTHSRKHKMVWA